MPTLTMLFLALVFLAELAAWAGIGWAAYGLAGGGVPGGIAAVVTVGAAIAAWALWAAPNAQAPAAAALATKVVVFGGAVVLLVLAGQPRLATGLAVLILIAHVGVHMTGNAPG